jgi:hypothetical protein
MLRGVTYKAASRTVIIVFATRCDSMKLVDWKPRLLAFMATVHETPFEWGAHDCANFVNGAIEAMTGERIKLPFTWSSEADADAVLDRYGGLDDAVSAFLGSPCQTFGAGAIAYAVVGSTELLAVHDGTNFVAHGLNGLRKIPERCVRATWRI